MQTESEDMANRVWTFALRIAMSQKQKAAWAAEPARGGGQAGQEGANVGLERLCQGYGLAGAAGSHHSAGA